MQNTQENPHRRTIRRIIAAILALAIAAAAFTLGWMSRYWVLDTRTQSLLWAIETAEDNYYREVDEDALYDDLFSAFSLDPYSGYYPKPKYQEQEAYNAGHRAGIGATIVSRNGGAVFSAVGGNSPAERAGIRAGMNLYGVGTSADTVTEGTAAQLIAKVREAEDGEHLFLRCGFSEEEAAVIDVVPGPYRMCYCLYADGAGAVRFDPATLQPFSVPFESLSIPENTAYIRLTSFHGTAAEEFEACLGYMKEAGKTDLVLDLRANGGGSLDTFTEIATFLMKNAEGKSPEAAYAEYRDGHRTLFYAAGNRYGEFFTEQSRVTVLADSGTASASECLIGAMVSYGTVTADDIYILQGQDGAHTYGKGIMQSYFPDAFGNMLKLTVAEIFWPNGESIHGKGVWAKDEDHAIAVGEQVLGQDGFLAAYFARVS